MNNILRVVTIAKPLYSLIGIIMGLIVVSAALELVSPIIFKYIVDDIVAKIQNQGGSLQHLIFLIALSFGLNFIGIITTALSERLGDHFSGRIRQYLTERFYSKVLTLPQAYFDTELSGKIINQLTRGITTLDNFFNSATNFFLPTFLQIIFTLVVLAFYSIPITILTFVLFPIYTYLSYLSTVKWGEKEEQKNKLEDTTRGRISEVITNIKVVKGFTNEKKEWSFVSQTLKDINQIYAGQSNAYHLYNFLRNLSLIIVFLLINIIVFYNTYMGVITIGTMVLILQLIAQARRPLFAMTFILESIQRAEKGSKEFFDIIELPSGEDYTRESTLPVITNPHLRFDHVWFSYETAHEVLKDISFELNPNEKVALVGHSGAGKTTLINLILKLYTPTKGDIYLNNHAYSVISHQDARKNIALVFQENELFSSTIAENVAYGQTPDEKSVIKALKMANAYEFVKKLPQGINSDIGERGIRLSGGQKQRIQIARAIYSNRPILILDEATSSLDSKSERLVHMALDALMKDKLSIIIAHRFSTIQNVDRIFVIDNGEIVDSGTPKELSKRPGIYADLLRYQIEGDKKLLESFDIY